MHDRKANRRHFLSAALLGLPAKAERPIEGRIVDDSHLQGHKLRDAATFAAPRNQVKVPVVIVGGGIAGLSAGWRLEKKRFQDFVILELEREAGGNSRWGENEASPYPWAAHYLPVPNRKSTLVRELCSEFGLLDADGRWSERHLCHTPQERLFLHGRWQEGLEPEIRGEHEHFRRFEDRMREFAASGQFTIPAELGAVSSALDSLSMDQWMQQERFTSPYLRWYVDYACRDDYGSLASETSAWAGIHYFASREHEERGPLTWPEGNGWIARKLLAKLGRFVQTGEMVVRVERNGRGFRVRTEQTEYLAKAVIWAAPTFLLRYVSELGPELTGLTYSPWLTANLTLDRMPRQERTEMAWDNVIYNSPALGYVVATHQSLRSRINQTVWTYYWALAHRPPAEMRRLLLEKDWAYWKELILNDLAKAHPDIRQCVKRIDVMRLGHAMARPVPGWMFNESRRRLARRKDGLVLANSDLSGFSIFEEAQYRGVAAADEVYRRLT